MSPVRTRKWNGTVLLGGNGEVPGWSNPIVLGVTKPIGGVNVGAGFYQNRPFPTAVLPTSGLPAGVTYNSTNKRYTLAAGVLLEDWIIPGFLTGSAGSKARNCYVRGPAAENAVGQGMVEGPSTVGQMELEWSTIDPVVASPYYDGIGRGVIARYCDIKNITDGTRGYSTSVNGVRIQCYGVHFHSAAQFRPDYATGGRAETHNDVGVQCQGNPGGDNNDLYFEGCWADGRHSTTKGTIPPTRTQIAAIMVTPASGVGAVHMTFTAGWLSGGMYCVNMGSDGVNAFGASSAVITNNVFEKPGTDIYGDGCAPDIALAVDPTMDLTHFGNVYDDGTPVPRTNA